MLHYLFHILSQLFKMKFGVYFLVFSMAFALVLADYENYDDDDEYDDETETDLATTNEDGHLSLFDLIEDLEHLQNPMTAEKRGRKGKGRKGRGKGRKKLSHSKNQKIGGKFPCVIFASHRRDNIIALFFLVI